MITIYTTPSCSSCRKAKKWLDDHKITYEEKNLFNQRITEEDIDKMLANAENGFDDIISTRSKVFKESYIESENMKFSEMANFIIDNPTILKRPIIINDQIMQTGYNKDEIRAFIPRELRDYSVCTDECPECEYRECVERALAKAKLGV